MGTGAALEKSAGRTGGQREAGKKGEGVWVGVDGRVSERAGDVYVAYLLVHCRAILSCSALLVRY